MAIVFDTHAELEAFCEAFELRETPQKSLKPRQKFKLADIEEAFIVEPALMVVEEQPVAEELPYTLLVDTEVLQESSFIDHLLMDLAS